MKNRRLATASYAEQLQMKKIMATRAERDDAAMVAMQLACVALNDTEGLGCVRLTRFARRLHQLIQEFYSDRPVGEVHLKARLEELGFIVQDGRMFGLQDEDGNVLNCRRVPTDCVPAAPGLKEGT